MIAQARQQKNSLNRPEWREQKESHDMSKNENKSAAVAWTSVQAYALSVICRSPRASPPRAGNVSGHEVCLLRATRVCTNLSR